VDEVKSGELAKPGVRKAILVIIGAVLMMSPAFISRSLLNRLSLELPEVAIVALAIFLVGVYLLLKAVRD
jgi:uncharacterized membrane protein